MYTLFEYKMKYQEEEVAKIKSMLFQAIAGYTLRKSDTTYHTKRHYIESKKPLHRLKASVRVSSSTCEKQFFS